MSLSANAAFIELGGSMNYRSSGYDENNYIQSLTYTASASYYFWEMCAWELNFTKGSSKQVTKGSGATDNKTTVQDLIELTSLDLVMSFASRQDPFRPYVKLGGGHLTKFVTEKSTTTRARGFLGKTALCRAEAFGLSLNVTKEFSIKLD